MSASSARPEPAPLIDLRCRGCRRLLCKLDGKGRVELVCRDCKVLTAYRPKPAS